MEELRATITTEILALGTPQPNIDRLFAVIPTSKLTAKQVFEQEIQWIPTDEPQEPYITILANIAAYIKLAR